MVASIGISTFTDALALGAIYALMAVGIGLVFGVLRLVNFAYGQLIMVGAYTLAFTSSWPLAASLLTCVAVVVAFSLLMDLVVFRPLRNQSSAVMLVTTFAIAFLLQAIALIVDLRDNFLGRGRLLVDHIAERVDLDRGRGRQEGDDPRGRRVPSSRS